MSSFTRLLSLAFFVLLARVSDAAPTISTRIPASGATVSSLTSISITYSEAVAGVSADDLLINAEGASFVTGAGPYVFTFTQPPPGTVNVVFDGDHGIAGQSGSGAFAGGAWTYTLTDTIAPTVAQMVPASGAVVGSVAQAEVVCSEPVTGVDAADLLVNGVPAMALAGTGAGP